MKIEEKERRIIRVNIKRIKSLVSVHMENYVEENEKIEFKDGLPVSFNKDKNYHGFGMRSMKKSVEKYNGNMEVGVRDNIFSLDMLIPLNEISTGGGQYV